MSFAFAQLLLLLLLKLPKGLVQTRFAKLLDPRTHAELLNRVLTVFHGRFDLGSFFYFSLFSSSCPSWMLELFDVGRRDLRTASGGGSIEVLLSAFF
jgi:hypothetical protein